MTPGVKARAKSNYNASFWIDIDGSGYGFWFLVANGSQFDDDIAENIDSIQSDSPRSEKMEREWKQKLQFSIVPSMLNVLEFQFNLKQKQNVFNILE